MEITITEALSRVKMLEKKFNSKIESPSLIAVRHGSSLMSPYSSYKPEDFEDKARATDQSITDTLKLYLELKKAIAKSNCETKVTIAGQEMTVQEAIILKQCDELRRNRIRAYKRQLTQANGQFERALEENRDAIERLTKGDSSADKSRSVKQLEEFEKSYNTLHKVELVDPCNLQKEIEEMEREYEEFKTNVDFVLSTSNSTTVITIPD